MEPTRQLRLALSMRGGVSLAVWIGGATQEIDRVRRGVRGSANDSCFHSRLLRLAGFDSVSIDVITGASAGGLNGVLLSWAMVTGGELDGLRDLWVANGDVSKLLRPESGFGSQRSLFKGDGYFFPILRDALARIAKDPSDVTRRHLQLIAAGTLLRPERVRIGEDESTRADEQRSDTYFHVARLGPPALGLDGFSAPDIEEQLALIGRASSSFPVAFEPAQVPFANGSQVVALRGRFARAQLDRQSPPVIDGGVLDNIPVARAIHAIAAAAANQPTDRALLFLHPDPSELDTKGDVGDDAVSVVQSLSGKRSESLLTDIDELRIHNARVTFRGAERDLLLAALRRRHGAHDRRGDGTPPAPRRRGRPALPDRPSHRAALAPTERRRLRPTTRLLERRGHRRPAVGLRSEGPGRQLGARMAVRPDVHGAEGGQCRAKAGGQAARRLHHLGRGACGLGGNAPDGRPRDGDPLVGGGNPSALRAGPPPVPVPHRSLPHARAAALRSQDHRSGQGPTRTAQAGAVRPAADRRTERPPTSWASPRRCWQRWTTEPARSR